MEDTRYLEYRFRDEVGVRVPLPVLIVNNLEFPKCARGIGKVAQLVEHNGELRPLIEARFQEVVGSSPAFPSGLWPNIY